PDADEVCNNRDDDCDTGIDEGVLVTYYADQDVDTFGDDATTTLACTRPQGFSPTGGDCDDGDSGINPNADEVCDQQDQDCDTLVDEGALLTFYGDPDGDGYGAFTDPTKACEAPEGYVSNASDCDSTDATINPQGVEVCGDGIDQNCNGRDLSCDVTDNDGDGFTPLDGDCDDDDATVYPGASELCDGQDNDCDGRTDEALNPPEGGEPCANGRGICRRQGVLACLDGAIRCDAQPGRPQVEICNGLDDDCDGTTDELPGTGEPCVVGVGACQRQGLTA
ncbi:MAG: putative metal-binding motif-containing protein, partial [Myxococcales bacterium]|nr:putative metal-binding motif-containing protein [Myxococcales bacterium]